MRIESGIAGPDAWTWKDSLFRWTGIAICLFSMVVIGLAVTITGAQFLAVLMGWWP